jgi:putative transposase
MIRYIDEHRRSFGVEPICRTLAVAPSTYYAAKARPPSARSVSDATLADVIGRVHRANFGVYGIRKVWKALGRLRIEAGRDQVARVMHLVGLRGATRAKGVHTTKPAPLGERPADLVNRTFAAPAPDRLWVADLTYVWTVRGFCYAAFIVDVLAARSSAGGSPRRCGPTSPSTPSRWRSGRGVRGSPTSSTTAIAASSTSRSGTPSAWPRPRRSARSGARATAMTTRSPRASTASTRPSSSAATRCPWRSADEVELATAAWVHWWNTERLHEACGYLPPVEYEAAYHQLRATTEAA